MILPYYRNLSNWVKYTGRMVRGFTENSVIKKTDIVSEV